MIRAGAGLFGQACCARASPVRDDGFVVGALAAGRCNDMIDNKSRHLRIKMDGVKAKARDWAKTVKEALPASEYLNHRHLEMAGIKLSSI